MGLSKEEIEKRLQELEHQLEVVLKNKDLEGIADLYHPEAVLIHKGVQASYGRDAVKEAYKPFLEGTFDASIKPHGYAAEADNGEYLIRRSTYTVGKNPKEFAFEQIYKKHNGKYLIYHDEFEYST